jgi:hypothetical protein
MNVVDLLEEALRGEGCEAVATVAAISLPVAGERPVTWFQFRSAFALAKVFGHEWTFGTPDGDEAVMAFYNEANGGDPAAIVKLTRARRQDSNVGIEAPVLVDGNVVHKTGTGRVEWVVDRAGDVTVTVTRPSGPVLRVASARMIDGCPYLAATRVGVEKIGMRHLLAAYQVFAALGRGEGAFVALHDIVVDEQ